MGFLIYITIGMLGSLLAMAGFFWVLDRDNKGIGIAGFVIGMILIVVASIALSILKDTTGETVW